MALRQVLLLWLQELQPVGFHSMVWGRGVLPVACPALWRGAREPKGCGPEPVRFSDAVDFVLGRTAGCRTAGWCPQLLHCGAGLPATRPTNLWLARVPVVVDLRFALPKGRLQVPASGPLPSADRRWDDHQLHP